MKLTLQPTDPTHGPKIAISVPYDDQTIHDLLDDMIIPALVAQGFHPQTIQDSMRDVTVPGAAALPASQTPFSTSFPPGVDLLPEDFAVIGFDVDDIDSPFDEEDLRYWDGDDWYKTCWANGGGFWYAARIGSSAHEALTGSRGTPDLPPLPPAPEGYSGWTEPALCPKTSRTVERPMAFFHKNGEDEGWILSDSGTYGGGFNSYPVYFIEAIA